MGRIQRKTCLGLRWNATLALWGVGSCFVATHKRALLIRSIIDFRIWPFFDAIGLWGIRNFIIIYWAESIYIVVLGTKVVVLEWLKIIVDLSKLCLMCQMLIKVTEVDYSLSLRGSERRWMLLLGLEAYWRGRRGGPLEVIVLEFRIQWRIARKDICDIGQGLLEEGLRGSCLSLKAAAKWVLWVLVNVGVHISSSSDSRYLI